MPILLCTEVILILSCAAALVPILLIICAKNRGERAAKGRSEKSVKKPRMFKPKTYEEKKAIKRIAEGGVCDERGNATVEDAKSDWGDVQKVVEGVELAKPQAIELEVQDDGNHPLSRSKTSKLERAQTEGNDTRTDSRTAKAPADRIPRRYPYFDFLHLFWTFI
ncbi:unnamed protein product [Toxocara canis]|uniref:Uncharacterized protein n=1 Tax=Toxocara canis TaxID=6265 RepID=A0A183V5J5_TOXCA|nr:unnamed protein product [Toxocara canis]